MSSVSVSIRLSLFWNLIIPTLIYTHKHTSSFQGPRHTYEDEEWTEETQLSVLSTAAACSTLIIMTLYIYDFLVLFYDSRIYLLSFPDINPPLKESISS